MNKLVDMFVEFYRYFFDVFGFFDSFGEFYVGVFV